MSLSNTQWWVDDLTEVCVQFQLDLSCLVDGELDEVAAGRAIGHLEGCSVCREFFEDTRDQVRAHRDLGDPEAIAARYSTLLGAQIDRDIETIEMVHRLATVFYQLGKAYVLTAVDPGFKVRIFEKAVPVGSYQTKGRGFVDGVLQSGRGSIGGLDWMDARHMLNGQLERIESPLEKGRRLLDEAILADPTHEEARLYLAFLDEQDGKKIRASNTYRQIFRTAVDEANRGHAAIRLAALHAEEGEYKKAIACNRWVSMSGLEDSDDRFWMVRFNIGINYANLSDQVRALRAFRTLIDKHPDRIADIAQTFLMSASSRAVIDSQPGFTEALFTMCPELFMAGEAGSPAGAEEDQL